tara:strand:- start:333 stop:434 length:102 start_codon:yes stop_codon:yes gene_type:complete
MYNKKLIIRIKIYDEDDALLPPAATDPGKTALA